MPVVVEEVKMVAKGDFDNNGATDLFVTGKIGYNEVELCILSKGGNKYEIINFDNVLRNTVYIVPFNGVTDGLILYKQSEQESSLEIDTLRYYDTFFIEKCDM